MAYHAFYSLSGWSEVLTRIEIARVFNEVFSDLSCDRESDVCVDVDFADAVFYSFEDHVFRNTLCAGDLAAVLVALVNEFRNYSRSSVKYERCVRDDSVDLF